MAGLSQNVFYDFDVVGGADEAFVQAVVVVAEGLGVEAKEIQQRGVELLDVDLILGRAEADCAIDNYSVHMNLAATTPPDDSWPAGVELTQLDDTTITWMAAAGGEQTVDLRAALR